MGRLDDEYSIFFIQGIVLCHVREARNMDDKAYCNFSVFRFSSSPPLRWPPLPLLLAPNSSIVQQLLLLLPSGPKLALLLVLPTHYLPHPLALFCSAKGPPGPRPTDRGIDMRLGVSAPPYIYPVIPSSSSLQAHRISIISFSARFSHPLPLPLHLNRSSALLSQLTLGLLAKA